MTAVEIWESTRAALVGAVSEHGCDNSFSCTWLHQIEGAPSPMLIGKFAVGLLQDAELETYDGTPFRVTYSNGCFRTQET